MARDFLDYYLLDSPNNWNNTDLITYYEMGKDVWNSSNSTRIDVTTYDALFLNENNQLSNSTGNGSTSFVSDPRNPSPTIGGATLHSTLDQGPYDQISLESRGDIIAFESATATSEISISGNVTLDLFVEADQPDCDISVRLVDVYPDGRNMLITDGIKRMRFRNGYTAANEAFMTPGTIYQAQVQLAVTNYTWEVGHKIKAYIGGNSSYRWDVNLQNGGTMYVAGDTNVANITVHHSSTYPSKINLPGSNPTLSANKLNSIHFSMYPNPTNDVLVLQSEEKITQYSIVDLSGRILKSSSYTNGEINVKELRSGSYILKVEINGTTVSRPFIKI